MTAARIPTRLPELLLAGSAVALLAGCQAPLDFDLRGNFGNAPSTAEAARSATADRPAPDNRGVLSYPGYQVAIAERGDTVQDVALRVGTDAAALARYNGLQTGDTLREGEVIALPNRVAEPSPATGASSSQIDITTLAGNAIDRAQPGTPATQSNAPTASAGVEPVRHKVKRGETAYTIARLYNVSVRALADWNGLGRDFGVREGQYLLIPVAEARTAATETTSAAPAATTTTALEPSPPGTGSPTPTPPSASKPLPQDTTPTASAPKPATPDLGQSQTSSGNGKLAYPVQGRIIRDYAQGRNEGIDIQASAGTPIKAAAGGTVAAITSDADQVPIVVIKHPDNLLTVYANVEGISVKKGDSVTRGQSIARIRGGNANYVHFEVRKGFDSVDPTPYLN